MIYIVWPDIWPCRWITIHQFGTVQLSLDGHQIRPGELGIKKRRELRYGGGGSVMTRMSCVKARLRSHLSWDPSIIYEREINRSYVESQDRLIKSNGNDKSHADQIDPPPPPAAETIRGTGMLAAVETGHALPRDSCETRELPGQVSTTHDKTHAGQCAQEQSSGSLCCQRPRWKHLQTCGETGRAERNPSSTFTPKST